MHLQEFIDTWNGRRCDFDNAYGSQCEDLAQYWNRDGVGAPPLTGNAVDAWHSASATAYTRIPNAAGNAPSPGDIVIWQQSAAAGTGVYGHIAIAVHGDPHSFVSFDQNWPTGSPCHLQTHDYDGVIGWLHPHVDVVGAPPKPPPPPPPPAPTPDAYAAAAWISAIQKMSIRVPVAQCAARKAEVLEWLKTHA
jgi:hypothetical protein